MDTTNITSLFDKIIEFYNAITSIVPVEIIAVLSIAISVVIAVTIYKLIPFV